MDVYGLCGDEPTANKQRDRAVAEGLSVGDVYQSGDEWGFNASDGKSWFSSFSKGYGSDIEMTLSQSGSPEEGWDNSKFALGIGGGIYCPQGDKAKEVYANGAIVESQSGRWQHNDGEWTEIVYNTSDGEAPRFGKYMGLSGQLNAPKSTGAAFSDAMVEAIYLCLYYTNSYLRHHSCGFERYIVT